MATGTEAALRRLNEDEVDWRLDCLSEVGHGGRRFALEIASSGIDLHDVLRLIQAGCPLELVWKIRAPLSTVQS